MQSASHRRFDTDGDGVMIEFAYEFLYLRLEGFGVVFFCVKPSVEGMGCPQAVARRRGTITM